MVEDGEFDQVRRVLDRIFAKTGFLEDMKLTGPGSDLAKKRVFVTTNSDYFRGEG